MPPALQLHTGWSVSVGRLMACCYSSTRKVNLKKAESRQWLIRQMNDKYVKLARVNDFRCRSAFKLLQINEKHAILKPGMKVLDCGAAPGSWSQVAAKLVNSVGTPGADDTGYVLSIDRDSFYPVDGCVCVRNADFTQETTRSKIQELLNKQKLDVLLSDMAPNATGHGDMDHEQIVELQTKFVEFSMYVLKDEGTLLCKLWEGNRTRHFLSYLGTIFTDVKVVKPAASRSNSAEIFVLARGYENPKKSTSWQENLQ